MSVATTDQLLTKCSISTAINARGLSAFRVHAPSRDIADSLKAMYRQLAREALALGQSCTEIFWPECGRPYEIPVSMAATQSGDEDTTAPASSSVNREGDLLLPDHFNLLGADYCQIHEFLADQRRDGKIVIITSNTTNICYHTNDLLRPERGILKPHEWAGYNYLRSWRASVDDWEHLNPEFESLQTLLDRDGQVRGYDYSLFRPDDAHCRYSTDYYLCRDYMGDEIRIGVSSPADWELLVQGQGAAIARA
jgi:hypothetical protein